MQDDDLLTVRDIMIRLSVNEKTVRRWISNGELSAFLVGGKYMIYYKDLKLFLENHRKKPLQKETPPTGE